jgi:peptidoglycan/LPS O-acetylase OafA/YrhL
MTVMITVHNEAVSLFAAGYAICIFLGVVTPHFHELPASFLTRAAHYIAKYSYGIYLSHLPLMWIVYVPLAGAPAVVRWGFLVVASTAVPVLLFHLVEDPMIQVGKRLAARFFEKRSAYAIA